LNKKALVLLNIGGVRTKDELEIFLRNMFNDKNIISFENETIRSMIASFLLTIKLNKTWQEYEQIEDKLSVQELIEPLVKKLNILLPDYFITTAMRYNSPFAQTAIARIKRENIKEVVLLPLYPHYSTRTVKSCIEDFVKKAEDNFTIQIIEPFYKNTLFNQAICDEIVRVQAKYKDFHLIFSAIGFPQKAIKKGDNYNNQVEEHFELLKEKLSYYAIELKSINLAFQSKKCLTKCEKPSLEEMLKNFKNKKVIIYPLSLTIDNNHTLFELDIKYREIAKKLQIKEYRICQSLNSNDTFCDALKEMITL